MCMRIEDRCSTRLSHKEWRKIAKKMRRSRLRRATAQERDANEEQVRASLENNAEYLNWRAEHEKQEAEREAREREECAEREKLWLEEEIKAQKKWRVLQEQKAKIERETLEEQKKILEEREAKQEELRKLLEEKNRQREEQLKKQEQAQKEINDYIDSGIKTPEILRELLDSKPNKELCLFFTKTGVCKYGDACSKNHRRVLLSKKILIPGFYSHFSLEKNSAEYDTDVALEFESSERRHHFREFFDDVVKELETFGKIKTFKCCCNIEVHLRGNLYVEYNTEREAARAWRNLKGRWYAGKKLHCEFVNMPSWRSAICGMHNCPKGSRGCNFLHTFRNPHSKYNIKSPPRWVQKTLQEPNSKISEYKNKSDWESIEPNSEDDRDWRWSQSPEIELDHCSKNSEKRRCRSIERERSHKSSRDKKNGHSKRSNARSTISPEKHHRSSRKKTCNDEVKDDSISDNPSSKKYRKNTRSKNNYKNSHKLTRKKH